MKRTFMGMGLDVVAVRRKLEKIMTAELPQEMIWDNSLKS
jgi:hypothetical protein